MGAGASAPDGTLGAAAAGATPTEMTKEVQRAEVASKGQALVKRATSKTRADDTADLKEQLAQAQAKQKAAEDLLLAESVTSWDRAREVTPMPALAPLFHRLVL